MKPAMLVVILGFSTCTFGQAPIMVDIKGEPMLSISSGFNVQGSYYFQPDYSDAVLIFRGGKHFYKMPVKLNLMNNQLVYQMESGQEMVMSTPIGEVRFLNSGKTVFKSGFPPVNRLNEGTYYEQLDSGRAILLKHYAVTFWDEKPYGGAPTRNYEQKPEYFVFVGSRMVALDKGNPAAVAEAFSDKKELADYIKSKNLKFKKEEDYIAATKYYNSL